MTGLSRLIVILLLLSVPFAAAAQSPQTTSAPSQPLLKQAELDQMLAPIALYPDPLLTQVLIASTYPLEVVQADRWAKNNGNLKGDALTAALAKQSWDDSIKSLVQTPTVLAMMAEQLDWTQKLGDAMLAQQADVMDSVQRLRGRAQANGKLKTSKEQTVTIQTEGDKQYVVIEPASDNQLYVPYYEPAAVYGDWPYPDYAPYYFAPPPGYFASGVLAAGIAFGAAVAIRHAFWGNCDWGRHNINLLNRNVNINNFNRNDRNNFTNWQHNADHRHGVKYNNAEVRQKFAKTDVQAGKAARQDFRGREGQQVLDPGRDRPGTADRDRPGAGDRDRPGAGDRPGVADRDRPSAGDRPGGDRAGGAGKADGARDRPSGGASKGASKGGGGPKQAARPSGGGQKAAQRPSPPKRDTAYSNVGSGRATQAQANRGRQSYGGGGGGRPVASGGGGGRGGGGGGGRGGGGGGRRSDIALKHDIVLIGHLDNGLGFYRFSYNGSDKAYVGVMAQEVQSVAPDAVVRGRDGYLRVFYEKLGLKFQTYDHWIASGARLPAGASIAP